MNGFEYDLSPSHQERIFFNKDLSWTVDIQFPLVVLLRVRNEEIILKDTLDHLAGFADLICAYDDASTDETFQILMNHPKVAIVIKNYTWLSSIEERLESETRHRGLLLKVARSHFNFEWCMCCDADERFVGGIRDFVMSSNTLESPKAVRISLFDAYMTDGDDAPIPKEGKLLNFRKYFGPERRDILMLWRNSESVKFVGLDAREPAVNSENIKTLFYCQHYGKSLSYVHWEDTCEYYAKYFPWDTYGKKWHDRRGKALHTQSDFGRQLYKWGPLLFANAVKIH